MTERFEANDYYHFILDNETNHEISVTEATELLNRLYRENQGLNEFSNKVFEFVKLLICIALQKRGLTDEENKFLNQMEHEYFYEGE